MIPFLPFLCYLIATYLEKQKRREISFWAGALPFLLTIVLVYMGREQGKYSEYLGWVLVDALVNIRAKPGWLILVAGYTDATGDEKSNQQLSLRRAEAVRNWMLQTSDIPATCFAVQGLGESQPAATNDTPQGRAVNRRVEISLVPRSDACQDVK